MLKKSINTMIITMISRVLGLFRGTLVAYFFGASVLTGREIGRASCRERV